MLSCLRKSSQRSNRASEQPLATNYNASLIEFLPPKSPKHSFCMRLTFKHADLLRLKEQKITSFHAPPLHWHWNQSETFQVEKGAIIITIDGKIHKATAADGPLTIPAGSYHTFDIDYSAGEDLVFVAWSPEEDGVEEVFFRNLFSYLDDCQRSGTSPSLFQSLLFLHSHDVSPALPGLPKWLGKAVSKYILGFIGGKVIGKWLLGYKSSYKEYVNIQNDKTNSKVSPVNE